MECIDIGSTMYPPLLKEIHNPPRQLYCEGDVSLLQKKNIAIVGTRTMTGYGRSVIEEFLQKILCELDIVVVSGMAKGVDTLVHTICLKRGIPTIAVLPMGINRVYPPENIGIYEDISRNGLLVSEYIEVKEVFKCMFPLRNRITAGLSEKILVIEAGERSGSLITANFGLEYGRDIYVIPGNINNNMSHGCNMLAKQGANILTNVSDFLEIFGVVNDQLTLGSVK